MSKLLPPRRAGKQERRHLALHFPWLPAERLIRTRALTHVGPPDTPFALVGKQRGALRLTAVSPAAHALGMMPGLALADARARVPELAAFDADPEADAALLERLAEGCLRYTPRVEVDGHQGLLLDISGCAHLFGKPSPLQGGGWGGGAVGLAQGSRSPTPLRLGIEDTKSRYLSPEGERELTADLIQRLARAGYSATHATSPSADAAMALATYGLSEGEVARLPVSALRCDPAVHQALRRAGLNHISDLASRPRTILAARFGEGVTRLLARLLGEIDTPIIPRRSRPPIRCEARFAEPVGHLDSIRAVLAELAADAVVQLSEQGLGARKVEARLFRCDGQARCIGVETAAPTRDPALIMRLFAERIEALNDPLDPGFGYDQIELAIVAAEPLAADQRDFEGSAAKAREELAALLARLATRLGPDRVTRWQAVDSHVPERVACEVEAINSSPERGGGLREARWRGLQVSTAALGLTPPPSVAAQLPPPRSGEELISTRPLLLLDPPEAVDAIAEVPDGPPYRFRWRGSQHRVARHEGPERIAMPWWQGKGSDRLTRDYYRVEDVEGRRFWLFRHGLYSEKADPGWYLHGLFA
jgi:protein ImuB